MLPKTISELTTIKQSVFRHYIAPSLFLLAIAVILITYKSIQLSADCGCRNISDTLGGYQPDDTTAYFLSQPLTVPLAKINQQRGYILGDSVGDEKWIEVDLSDQILRAWQGNRLFLATLVSTGKWGKTPTGEFQIWSKFKYTKMSGGSKEKGTYYYLPNVPYTMYFKGGFGIHGTYWHSNFGTPMSHGCINMPTPMAEQLFYWAGPELPEGKNSWIAKNNNYGTRVVIHE